MISASKLQGINIKNVDALQDFSNVYEVRKLEQEKGFIKNLFFHDQLR